METGLQVIGIGMPRTGTTTLKEALKELGYGEGYHLSQMIDKHPDHFTKWTNLSLTDLYEMFNGYYQASDTPVNYFFKELQQVFPDAKFIYTQREDNDWYNSIFNTIQPHVAQLLQESAQGNENSENLYKMLYSVRGNAFDNKESAIRHKHEHEAKVREIIPANKLLIYRVTEGWEPLCKFLGKDVPNIEFPHLNNDQQFTVNYINKYKL